MNRTSSGGSPRLHPLAYRVLGALGATLLPASFMAGCDTPFIPGGCPNVAAHDEKLDNCTVHVGANEAAAIHCVSVPTAANGMCPDSSSSVVSDAFAAQYMTPSRFVCGTFPSPGTSSTSSTASGSGSSSSASGSVGGGGAGGGGSGGGGGAGGGATSSTASGSGSSSASTGGNVPMANCCYGVVEPLMCVGGRPLIVEGEARVARAVRRSDWQGSRESERIDDLAPGIRALLADAWTREAALEHASIASFARFALELLSVGAPSDLVEAASRAMLEETNHARLCYALASRHAGRQIGPDRLDLGAPLPMPSLAEIVYTTVRDGCVGETIAAIVASEALEKATDEEARRALAIITEDESSHAELAYRFVAYAISQGDPLVRDAVRRGFDDATASFEALGGEPRAEESADARAILEAHGRLGHDGVRRAIERSLREVVAPARAMLLG